MITSVIPTQEQLNDLRDRINEQKRMAEYQKLKNDLEEITFKAVNTPNDLDGAMQMPDTDRALQSKRPVHSIVGKMVDRALKMCAIQPIIGNIVALLLPILGIIFLTTLNSLAIKHGIHWFSYALPYFMKSSMIAVSLVIVVSSSRSILLPVLGMAIAGFFCSTLQGHETVLHFNFNDFLILGVASFIASLFSAIAVR